MARDMRLYRELRGSMSSPRGEHTVAADVKIRSDFPSTAAVNSAHRELKEIAREVVSLLPEIPAAARELLEAITDPSHLADIIAANIDATLEEKQAVLECRDVAERQKMVRELLTRQRNVLLLNREVEETAKQR